MPLGANKLGDNRFAPLSPAPKSKRKKPTTATLDLFPELPITQKDNPKYLVIKSKDEKKPISTTSCFAVYKGIQSISKDVNNITSLRDGSLLLLVKNQKIADKFLSTKHLPGAGAVEILLHNSLNSVKGTIYAPFICQLADEEIIEGLKDQGVIAVHKFTKLNNGKREPTGAILLTIEKYTLPSRIEVAWRTLDIRPYYPNPMRCKTCQLLGHTTKRCNSTPSCVICNLPPNHSSPSECTRVKCANCGGEHPASSNDCPKFVQSKEILKIKTIHKCSMSEAISLYKAQTPTTPKPFSYANITASSNNAYFNANSSKNENNLHPNDSNLNIIAKTSNNNNTLSNTNNHTVPSDCINTPSPSVSSLNNSPSPPFSPLSLSSSPAINSPPASVPSPTFFPTSNIPSLMET
ncbi:uncharacterized protein [Eurosta solidaginis]|uniref:uncharacterized protein n=1 Tax=Eurosta solidaginis TaxID=178769 RepID=UPI003530D3B1